jgi:hypothetical protein
MKTIQPTRIKSFAVILILLLTATIPAATALRSTSSPTTFKASNYWALCVGIGVYAENPEQDRPDMLSEVDTFAQTLLDSGYLPDHVKVIRGENATLKNIFDGFRWLRTHEKSTDVSVVFLSTHGSPLLTPQDKPLDPFPKDEADSVDEMLVTFWGFAIPTDVLIDDDINVELNHLPSQSVCLIVDSCYAGGFNDHWRLIKTFGNNVKGENRVVLMGSKEDEEAMSGGFAPMLIDGLRGFADKNHDGIVTAEEVFNYTAPRAFMQTPTIYDGFPGELPLVTLSSQKTEQTTTVTLPDTPMRSLNAGGLVHGFVKDAVSSVPIAGATVYLHGRTSGYESYENLTSTDPSGHYEITAPAGRYRLSVSADGYCDRDSGTFTLNDGQVKSLNITIYPRPAENATLCGYITDANTGLPMNGSEVSIRWHGTSGQSYTNYTLTDAAGFYSMMAAAGTLDVTVQQQDYFDASIQGLHVEDLGTCWENLSLVPHPAETAVICGYLTNADSEAGIANAQLSYQWMDIVTGRSYSKDTTTASDGFYTIAVAPGEVYRDIHLSGYALYDPYRHDGVANATMWQNVSMTPQKPTFYFLQPLNALYIQNKRVVPRSSPIVIGSVNVSIYFEDMFYGGGDVQKVEFYLDGKLKSTVTAEPYSWTWSGVSLRKHVLKVVAYDSMGLNASREVSVLKLL